MSTGRFVNVYHIITRDGTKPDRPWIDMPGVEPFATYEEADAYAARYRARDITAAVQEARRWQEDAG